MVEGPLQGIRILDLTHVWAGPLATRNLADLGAEVVKVEHVYSRGGRSPVYEPIGGWIGGDPGAEPWNRNALFNKLSRNSRSLCLDLKSRPGRELFLQLVAQADLVIENFSAQVMPSLGLGYAVLAAANPRVIYVTISGYGSEGPRSGRVAFGPAVEPVTGLTSVMGYSSREPRNTAMGLIDPITALTADSAVLTALRRRAQTGEGCRIELSLHESGVEYNGAWLVAQQLGETPHPLGNRHPGMAPHGVFRCRGEDAWVAVGCRHQADWIALCALLGAELDPAWDLAQRRSMEDRIETAIAAWTLGRDKQLAAQTLQAAGVPAGPVNTTPDMTADPQVLARGFFVPLGEPATPMPGTPVKLAGLSTAGWTPSPALGADNAAVLRDWLQLPAEAIAALQAQGVLADQPPD